MIRKATQADISSLIELESQCFHDAWSKAAIKASLLSSLDTWILIQKDTEVAGYLVLRTIFEEGELLRIGVAKKYRGRHFAKQLMDAMSVFVKKNGVKQILLEVRVSNETARNLYKIYGFEEQVVRKAYYHNPKEDALMMCKSII